MDLGQQVLDESFQKQFIALLLETKQRNGDDIVMFYKNPFMCDEKGCQNFSGKETCFPTLFCL